MPFLVKGSGLPRRQETGAARQRGGQEHSGGPGSGAWASTSPLGPGFSVWSGDGALEEDLADPCCTAAVTWSLLPLGFLDTESHSVAGGGWGGRGSEGRLASCTEVTPPPERGYQVRGGLCALMCVRQAPEHPGRSHPGSSEQVPSPGHWGLRSACRVLPSCLDSGAALRRSGPRCHRTAGVVLCPAVPV